MNNNMNVLDFYNLSSFVKKEMLQNMTAAYLSYLKDVAGVKIGMFDYEGLPDNLNKNVIELNLMFKNNLAFLKIEELNEVVLGWYTWSGELGINGFPVRVNFHALNGRLLKQDVEFEELILCKDNAMDIIPFIGIHYHIEKLIDIEGTLSNALFFANIPAFFECPKSMAPMVNEVFKGIKYKQKFVVGNANSFNITKIDIPKTASFDELVMLFNHQKNLMYQSIGVNAQIFKKERTTYQEVASQNDLSDSIYEEMKNYRLKFINELNEKYGLKIRLLETSISNEPSVEENNDNAV